MLFKIICIISILCKFNLLCYGIHISEYNETKVILSMNSQLSELKLEQERQVKLIDGLVKAIDIQDRQEKFLNQLLKAAEKLTDGLVKESDVQLVREDISSIRKEQERLGKAEDNKEKGIKSNREELDKLGKLISGLAKESNVQLLRTDIQSIKEDQERQGKLTDELVKNIHQLSLRSYPRNCAEVKKSGINEILLSNFSWQPFKVVCDEDPRGGGWTVILRRIDGSVNFQRNWTEHKNGFGDLKGEFMLGLDKIHALTTERDHELLVLLEDNDGKEAFETYDAFAIGNEEEQYVLHKLGNAKGTAGDSLGIHRGMKFATYDLDKNRSAYAYCAVVFTGGWWYYDCGNSKLTGTYNDNEYAKGIFWNNFRGVKYSLKRAIMMIRPKQ